MMVPDLASISHFKEPFPHFRIPQILSLTDAADMLRWLREKAPWNLRTEEFYEQDECSLLAIALSDDVKPLIGSVFTAPIISAMRQAFNVHADLTITEIAAHRLRPGHRIKVHNDYIGGEETHRLLIQLNDGWGPKHGGLLMFFNSEAAEDVRKIIAPTHASGLAFEISPRSFHAVSEVKEGERFTLVYSFRESR
jgi:hypothetical protein